MAALEVITGTVTAPGAAPVPIAAASGNSFTLRNFPSQDAAGKAVKAHLLTCWTYTNAAAILRIRSPRMHDFNQGIRLRSANTSVLPLLPLGYGDDQVLEAQDTLTVELAGSAVAGQIETACLLVYYEMLPGVEGRFIDTAALRMRAQNQVGNEVALNPGVAGGYSGQRAINFSFDTLKANKDYALLGMTTDVDTGVVRVYSADTGNLGVGIPGDSRNKFVTANWFPLMSAWTGVPLIPVFNAANKGSILVDTAQNQAGTAVNVTLILQELSPA